MNQLSESEWSWISSNWSFNEIKTVIAAYILENMAQEFLPGCLKQPDYEGRYFFLRCKAGNSVFVFFYVRRLIYSFFY